MEKIIQLKIEEAKSSFIIAQIFIIISGFLFTTAGIFYQNNYQEANLIGEQLQENSIKLIEINEKINKTNNLEELYQFNIELKKINSNMEYFSSKIKDIKSYNKFYLAYSLFAMFFLFLSLYNFYLGRKKIRSKI